MKSFRRLRDQLWILMPVAALATACSTGASSTEDAPGGGTCTDPYYCGSDASVGGDGSLGGFGGGSGGGAGAAGMLADAGANDAPALNPLCGVGCDPDWTSACTDEAGSPESPDAGADPDAGDDAEPGDASDESDGSHLPYPSGPESGPGDPDALAPAQACHVVRAGAHAAAVCEAAGSGQAGAPCTASTDCASGLGCAGPTNGGTCLPFCCGSPESCPTSTFCAERALRDDAASATPLVVPVCVPADGCVLLEPCGDSGNQVCTIVRSDGTTSCSDAGQGQLDDPCPCAFGFVCAKSTNKCLKLCHTGLGSTECPGGTCQGGSGGYPAGFGVCVGGLGDAG